MNALRYINEMRRKIRTIKVKCTAILPNGESKDVVARISVNKINRLNGNGLTSQALYKLAKTGKCETVDHLGNAYVYELLKGTERGVLATDIANINAIEAKEEAEALKAKETTPQQDGETQNGEGTGNAKV